MTEKPFLERWSGRKAAARDHPVAAAENARPNPETTAPASLPVADPATPDAAAAPISDEELAALPPVETLTEGSDIKAFLRPGVPAILKNAALRKMWIATPAIRDHKDIAVDYAWDWNTPGGVPGDSGTLNPERVAQWVRELSGAAKPSAPTTAQDTATAPDAAPTAEPTAEPTTAGHIDTEAAAPRRPAAATEPRNDAATVPKGSAERPEPPARPRHGGARPS